MKDIFAKVSYSFLLKILSAVLAYPTAILLARQLGADGYGVYGFVIALIGLMIYPTVLGQDQLIVRQSALVKEHFFGKLKFPLVAFSLRFIWLISITVASTVTLVIIAYPNIFGVFTNSIFVGIWILPFFSIRRIYTSLLRVLEKPVLAIFPESLVQPVVLFLLVLASLYLTQGKIEPQKAIFFQLIAYISSLVDRKSTRLNSSH